MLEALVAALVPFLVMEAEKVFGAPSQSHDWVHGFVDEVFSLFEQKLPGWIKPEEAELKKLISDAVEKVLSLKA